MRVELTVPAVDLIASLRSHRVGFGDPSVRSDGTRYAVAFHTKEGPLTLGLTALERTRVLVEAWGDACDALAPETLRAICGAEDDPEAAIAVTASMPRLQNLVRRQRLVRMPRVPWRYELALGLVLQQRVDFPSAAASYAGLIEKHGEPAPGPAQLLLCPRAETVRALPSWAFREQGIDGQRERAVRALCEAESAVTRAAPSELRGVLEAIEGFGPWTVESILALANGDADALPIGDYWLPHVVSRALLGKARSNDDEMTKLLQPFRPHRYRIIRVLYASGFDAERFGPKRPSPKNRDGGRR